MARQIGGRSWNGRPEGEEQEVPLSGVLAEFREALRAEIEAARRAAQSSAVQLVHGERIGTTAGVFQYLFKLENPQLALPDDLPGDLYIPGRDRLDATVISLAGVAVTLSVPVDVGQHVPRASLSSNLTNLLRSLIKRIEDLSEGSEDNKAGGRLLGEVKPSGAPALVGPLPDVNDEQRAAVASGLGRDTTFIEGPPGTGKTKAIGTLGEELARRGRSVLVVSHTNTAVDQALLHIARSLGPAAAADGKVLRLGLPKDERVAAQPDLLVATHVERRTAELLARQTTLQQERVEHNARIQVIERLIALCEWAETALQNLAHRQDALRELQARDLQLHVVTEALRAEEELTGVWEVRRAEAREARSREEQLPQLRAEVAAAEARVAAAATDEAQLLETADAEAARRLDVARTRGEEIRTQADEALHTAEEQRERSAEALDQARQLALMRERFERLPSAGFAASRVSQLAVEAQAAAAARVSLQEELGTAETRWRETTEASSVGRRFRRLPHPDEQELLVATTRASFNAADGRYAAIAQEWQAAQEQHAETVRLAEELKRLNGHPSVDACKEALARHTAGVDQAQAQRAKAEEAVAAIMREAIADARTFKADAANRAKRVLEREKAGLALAQRAVTDSTEHLARFAAEDRSSPADVLAEAARVLARLDQLRDEHRELEAQAAERERQLRALLEDDRAALRRFEFRVSTTEELEVLVGELRQVVPEAVAEARKHDPSLLRDEAAALRGRVTQIEAELAEIEERLEAVEREVVNGAMVLATTLTKAYLRDEVQARRFDTVVLDEASMAPIPALWVAAAVADANVVLVGDHNQLPPIALAAEDSNPTSPASRWLARDVFEAAGVHRRGAAPEYLVKLRTQYRMHPAISAVPNKLVYGGALRDGDKTRESGGLDGWYNREWGHDAPVLRVDTERADAWCSTVVAGGRASRLNFLSATIAVDLAERLLLAGRPPVVGGEARIIIATPYRPQARLISLLLRDAGLEGEVIAGTVHSFQGSEAPVVIYDLVVDEPHRKAGLFAPAYDESMRRQFNVGLTRARHRLFVIGDFKFLKANGKRAFIGQLLDELDSAPAVDAEQVVPVGLGVRAARAQKLAAGDEPLGSERVVVTQRDFDGAFLHDLGTAMSRIVIYSPFITENRLQVVGPQLRAAVERGVPVYVVTKTLDDRGNGEQAGYRRIQRTLRDWSVYIVPKKAMHEKLVFVDDDVVWVGSLNPLSFRDTREIMERRRNRKVSEDYRKALQLDVAFEAYEDGEEACPICGSEMALAEGTHGLYRRCVVPHCYSRGLTDPPLRDGKMACHTCGGEVYYGAWGDKPAWRCKENTRHRMDVHRNHLKLPAMRGLLSKRELKRLDKQFG